jgi:hypothetical protein
MICTKKLNVNPHDCRHNCNICEKVRHTCEKKNFACPTCKKTTHTIGKDGIKLCQYYNQELTFRNAKYNKILKIFNIQPDANNKRKTTTQVSNDFEKNLQQFSLFSDLTNKVNQLDTRQIKKSLDITKIKKRIKAFTLISP